MTKQSNTSAISGFSLVELMIVLVILGIISAFAMPGIKGIIENIQLYTTVNGIKRQLMCAKTRALGDSQLHCGVFFDTVGTADKVQVFLDNGLPINNGQYDQGLDQRIMGAFYIPPTLSLSVSDIDGKCEIVFRGDGSTRVQGVTVTVNTSRNRNKKVSVVSSTGRIRVAE